MILSLQLASPALAGLNVWTSGGPPGAGMYAVVADPIDGAVAYAVDSQGLFKTRDGGASWTRLDTWRPLRLSPRVVVIDPRDPATAFVGGDGLGQSRDGGLTWRSLAGAPKESANAIAVDPRDSLIVYAGTQKGPFRSADGGETWSFSSGGDR